MKKLKILASVFAASMIVLSSCKKKDPDPDPPPTAEKANLTLSFDKLEDLGPDYVYEGWIMVDGTPVTAGIFTVNADGMMSKTVFELDKAQLEKATAYVLTIEPANDPDPAPSHVHVLGGDFTGNTAECSIGHAAALGDDFRGAIGTYVLATPTTMDTTDELSGVWFLDLTGAIPSIGLSLPALPDNGWVYEGWAVVDGVPVSTGTFKDPTMADNFSGFSGPGTAPPLPGEDLIMNAPMGLTFPTDLSGQVVAISVEPVPDNSDKPFAIKPLVAEVSASAMDHQTYMMDNKAVDTAPKGTVSR